jgi:hypothetical protein
MDGWFDGTVSCFGDAESDSFVSSHGLGEDFSLIVVYLYWGIIFV